MTVAAIAGLSFSSADGAGAIAQEIDSEAVAPSASAEFDQTAAETIEIVPEQPVFVSAEVVQPLPETTAAPIEQQASSLRDLVRRVDTDTQMSEQMRCLAGAVYFESRGEPLAGQLAVAHVVINRSEDRRFPASYCGVVYQRAQFSFVKNGRMPRIRTGSAAWDRAKAIARIAHEDLWDSEAGDAVYFHAKYVRPSWSRRKTRTAQIDTHIFYR
ncbi:cell wall hydrolase [Erythrobacter sp. JK5]|uniref:cell wall hydrolase n=1 Tax=Erythrobacter sp. JK5 TaxID=2829500 RepID=UPI0035303008